MVSWKKEKREICAQQPPGRKCASDHQEDAYGREYAYARETISEVLQI
jgi:hypothetical protein